MRGSTDSNHFKQQYLSDNQAFSNYGSRPSETDARFQSSMANNRQHSGNLNPKTSYSAFDNAEAVLTPQPVARANTVGAASAFAAQRVSEGDRFGPRPNSSSGQSAGGDEDIKTKLARYKREREELEQVRQQLRTKNQNAVARSSPAATSMRMNSVGREEPRAFEVPKRDVVQPMYEQAAAN